MLFSEQWQMWFWELLPVDLFSALDTWMSCKPLTSDACNWKWMDCFQAIEFSQFLFKKYRIKKSRWNKVRASLASAMKRIYSNSSRDRLDHSKHCELTSKVWSGNKGEMNKSYLKSILWKFLKKHLFDSNKHTHLLWYCFASSISEVWVDMISTLTATRREGCVFLINSP